MVASTVSAPAVMRRMHASRSSLLVLALAAIPRIWAALWDGGVFLPDEIYQTLEPAHRLAFGWGLLTREFREGSRSWLFPGLIGALLKGASVVGVHSSAGLVGIAKLAMALVSLAGVWFVMGLARNLGGERAAILAGLLSAACSPLVATGSRCLPEAVSGTLVVLGALWLAKRGPRRAAGAGAVVTVTAFLRYPNGLLAVAFLSLLVAQRRRRDARAFFAGAAVTATLGGLLDWPTWGWPFRAFWVYLRVTLLEGRLAQLPAVPASYLPQHLASAIGLAWGLLLLGLVLALRSARGLVLIVVLFVVVQSLPRAKELGFVLPVLPLTIALAAIGLRRAFDGLGRGGLPTYACGIVCAAEMAWVAHGATRGELGFGASDWVIWHSGADYFRTTEAAAAANDLCGIVYAANEPAWTGGYTYLHRRVPIFFDTQPVHLAAANYVVGAKSDRLPLGWHPVHSDGGYTLFQRPGGCTPPPRGWEMNLP